MRICVLCKYPGRGEELPVAFHLGGRRLAVVDVLLRWSQGIYRFFEVCVDDGRRFVLRHDPGAQCWELAAVYAASRLQRAPERRAAAPAAPVAASASAPAATPAP